MNFFQLFNLKWAFWTEIVRYGVYFIIGRAEVTGFFFLSFLWGMPFTDCHAVTAFFSQNVNGKREVLLGWDLSHSGVDNYTWWGESYPALTGVPIVSHVGGRMLKGKMNPTLIAYKYDQEAMQMNTVSIY